MNCHVCAGGRLTPYPEFDGFHRVTSDCRPFRPGGRLFACSSCGCVQKAVDEAWRKECDEIYSAYTIYSQAGGVEQKVFDAQTGQGLARSDRLLQRVIAARNWPPKGRVLDVGCGNGAMLRSASRLLPGWSLCGTELNDRYRSVIEAIPGATLHVGNPSEIAGRFDLISGLHVVEHIPDPRSFLAGLRSKFDAGGALFVQTPDLEGNPVDLLIADHCTHFTRDSMARLLGTAGYDVQTVTSDWVSKEVSAVASIHDAAPVAPPPLDNESLGARSLEWLRRMREAALRASEGKPVGIFGSSIAATWIFSELEGRVSFFVDEDPDRAGRSHLGRPIVPVREIPRDSDVVVALAPAVADRIRPRLESAVAGARWHWPPPFDSLSR
jgi:hypothetical protein